MPERSINSAGARFGFNGKEKMNEVSGVGNSLDFGARGYDTRIGRWTAVDPLAAKYPNLSPYNFVGNNPIIAIDPNGKEIIIKRDELPGADGKPVITISFSGKILLEGQNQLSEDQKNALIENLTLGFKRAYSGNGETVNWKTGFVNISIATADNPLLSTDHAIIIGANGQMPDYSQRITIPWENNKEYIGTGINFGYAAEYERFVYLNEKIIDKIIDPNTLSENHKKGLTQRGEETISRVFSHEMAHSAGQPEHPPKDKRPGNVLHTPQSPLKGMKLDEDQILQMEKDYKNGNLNKGRQREDQMYNPKKK